MKEKTIYQLHIEKKYFDCFKKLTLKGATNENWWTNRPISRGRRWIKGRTVRRYCYGGFRMEKLDCDADLWEYIGCLGIEINKLKDKIKHLEGGA